MGVQQAKHQVRDIAVRLYKDGSGEPVVFLHGAAGVPPWSPFFEKLAARHALMLPEHPGFGASDTPDWLDHVGDLAYFYLDTIAALGLDGIHLVGHSLGGWIAAEIAVRDCHALRSLTLSAPAGIHVKGLRKADTFMWSPEQVTRNLVHDPALAEQMLAQPVTDEQQFARMKNRLTVAKLAWQPRFYNPHLSKWLHRIGVPTLILWGDDDRIIPPGYGPAFRDLIPGSRLETIADCSHLPQIERTDEWVGRIVRFIEGAAS